VQPRREKHVCADEPHWSFMLFSWLTVSGYYLCFTIDNRERRPVQIEIEILPDQIEKHPDVCRPTPILFNCPQNGLPAIGTDVVWILDYAHIALVLHERRPQQVSQPDLARS